MQLYPYNPKLGQRIQTFADGVYADRGFIAHLSWANPVAADADRLLADQATSATGATAVSEFLAQPDFPRQINITPGGTTTDVAVGSITVEGKDAAGESISEEVAIAADASAAVVTTKAFATITKITFPQQDGAGATFDVGITDKLGVPYALPHDTVLSAFLNGTKEDTAPTVTTNADDWSKNLIDLATALDGNKVDVYLIV